MSGPSPDQQGPPSADALSPEVVLRGHLAHLSAEEERAFATFKKLCAAEGLYKPVGEGRAKASHDDGSLMRYLRARRFVPEDALTQFRDTEKWRKDNDLEALYEKIDIDDYRASRSVYPQWTGRRDKRGIPVYLYEVHKLDTKRMNAYSSTGSSKDKGKNESASKMLRLFALYENLTRFVMPLCSAVPGRPNPETPVDQSNNIVDISKVGLKQFWNLRSHMQDASQLATAHYPETLDRIFILGAPSFFPTVWGWIKRWFDPITTSKMFILSQQQVLPTLLQFIDIEDIPRKYGGHLDFESGDMPSLDPALRDCLTIGPNADAENFFLTAPVRWLDAGPDGEMTALSVGSINGHQRREQVAVLHSETMRVATRTERLSRAATQQSIVPVKSETPKVPLEGQRGTSPSQNGTLSPAQMEAPVQQMANVNINAENIMTDPSMPSGTPNELTKEKTEFITPPSSPSELQAVS